MKQELPDSQTPPSRSFKTLAEADQYLTETFRASGGVVSELKAYKGPMVARFPLRQQKPQTQSPEEPQKE